MGGRSRAPKPEAPAPEVVEPTPVAAPEPPPVDLRSALASLAYEYDVAIAYDGTTITISAPTGALQHPDAGAGDLAAFVAVLRRRIGKLLRAAK